MRKNDLDFIRNKIIKTLDVWDFKSAEILYGRNKKYFYMEYILYMYKYGQFDNLLYELKNIDSSQWEKQLVVKLDFYSFRMYIEEILKFDNIKDVLCIINNSVLDKTSIVLFVLKVLIEKDELEVEYFFELFEKYLYKISDTSILGYCVVMIFDYIKTSSQEKKRSFFNHNHPFAKQYFFLMKLYQIDTLSSKFFLREYIFELKNFMRKTVNNKVAICINGVFRGDWKATINKIVEKLAIPLKADCFIYTWNLYQEWTGMSGGDSWIYRNFIEYSKEAPECIFKNTSLKQNFPNVFEQLSFEYLSPLKIKELEDMKNNMPHIKKVVLADETEFEYAWTCSPNNFKMAFNAYKVFTLLEEYEKENNIKYDFVFMIRSDSEPVFSEQLNLHDELKRLRSNEIADIVTRTGNGLGNIYGSRDVIKIYSSIYTNFKTFLTNRSLYGYKGLDLNSIASKKDMASLTLSFHDLAFRWLSYNGLIIVKGNIKFDFFNTLCLKGIKLPDFEKHLNDDLQFNSNKLDKEHLDAAVFFLEKLRKKFGVVSKDSIKRKIIQNSTNVLINFQGYLTYKLGNLYLNHNKTLLEKILFPIKFVAIIFQHDRKDKHDIIIDNYILKYDEKIIFEVGSLLLRLYKNWYKNNYFEMLKKLFQKTNEYKNYKGV
ncbi:hypothetical protein DSE64_07640 [Campylobacter lari]|nr:hypothetical protein [Campylobacter lari]